MRYKFIKRKFITYLFSFTLPAIIIGVLALSGLYHSEAAQVEERMENTVRLTEEILNGFEADTAALNRYLVNGRQLVDFYQTFTKEKVDYASSMTLNQISAYLGSMGSSRPYIDSVYFYIENDLQRVFTSEKIVRNLEAMEDDQWPSLLYQAKAGKPEIIGRTVRRDAFSGTSQLCSVFLHFTAWKGGTVVNYRRTAIEKGLESAAFYDGQQIVVLGTDKKPLFLWNQKDSELTAGLGEMADREPEAVLFSYDGQNYRMKQSSYAPFGAKIVTLVPEREIYATLFNNFYAIILMALVTVISSAVLSYYRAVHNYNQLFQIMAVFEKAEKQEALPEFTQKGGDLYATILNNLVHTFVQNSYLKVQLSERKYHQLAAELIALQYQINPPFSL